MHHGVESDGDGRRVPGTWVEVDERVGSVVDREGLASRSGLRWQRGQRVPGKRRREQDGRQDETSHGCSFLPSGWTGIRQDGGERGSGGPAIGEGIRSDDPSTRAVVGATRCGSRRSFVDVPMNTTRLGGRRAAKLPPINRRAAAILYRVPPGG